MSGLWTLLLCPTSPTPPDFFQTIGQVTVNQKKRPLTCIVIGSAKLNAAHPLDVVKRLSKNREPPICNDVTSRYAIFVVGELLALLLLLLHPGAEIDQNRYSSGTARRRAPRKLITQGLSGFQVTSVRPVTREPCRRRTWTRTLRWTTRTKNRWAGSLSLCCFGVCWLTPCQHAKLERLARVKYVWSWHSRRVTGLAASQGDSQMFWHFVEVVGTCRCALSACHCVSVVTDWRLQSSSGPYWSKNRRVFRPPSTDSPKITRDVTERGS